MWEAGQLAGERTAIESLAQSVDVVRSRYRRDLYFILNININLFNNID